MQSTIERALPYVLLQVACYSIIEWANLIFKKISNLTSCSFKAYYTLITTNYLQVGKCGM